MMTYGVIAVRGNAIQTLEICAEKAEALAAKERQRSARRGEDVHIAAVYGDFDAGGELAERRFRILY